MAYAFPTSAQDYLEVTAYPEANNIASFSALKMFQEDAAETAFAMITSYTGVTFVEVSSGSAADATFRFANFNGSGSEAHFPAVASGYAPTDARASGDIFLGGNSQVASAHYIGGSPFMIIAHEMGHAFGLKHGHDSDGTGALAPDVNGSEFSIMTYASYSVPTPGRARPRLTT